MKYSIILALQLLTAWAVCKENNCTFVPCITDPARINRREWPQFDFEFYHQSSNTLTESTQLPTDYSSKFEKNQPKPTSEEIRNTSLSDNASSNRSDGEEDNYSNNNQTDCQILSTVNDQIINKLDWSQRSYLLRSIFKQTSPQSASKRKRSNLAEYFRTKLLRVYQLALDKQKTSLRNINKNDDHFTVRRKRNPSDLNVTIWDIQTTKNNPEQFDVVYLVSHNNVPVPYDDAAKMLSFLDRETIQNVTEFVVVHKVLRYEQNRNESLSFVSSTATWKWLFILCAILLTILIIISIWLCYIKYKNPDPIGTLHHEISRLSRSRSNRESRHSSRLRDSSHQNLGLETSDSEAEAQPPPLPKFPPPPSLHRIDIGSQASLDPIYTKPSILTPISRDFSTLSNKIRGGGTAYPVNPNPDYDRISYIKTKETIEEKRKPSNIVEVQMSKETQSIVKEIRNELNRYNLKKIINDAPIDTSEA